MSFFTFWGLEYFISSICTLTDRPLGAYLYNIIHTTTPDLQKIMRANTPLACTLTHRLSLLSAHVATCYTKYTRQDRALNSDMGTRALFRFTHSAHPAQDDTQRTRGWRYRALTRLSMLLIKRRMRTRNECMRAFVNRALNSV